MLLANDCENDERMGDPSARSTELPELIGYDTSRDADGELERVEVAIGIETHRGNATTRYVAAYTVSDGTAVPNRVNSRSNSVDPPARVERTLTVLLAAQEAVGRLGDIDEVVSLRDAIEQIEATEPDNGYQPADAVAEVAD